MSQETTVREPERSHEASVDEPRKLELQAVLAQIRRDSQQAPDQYLDDSKVPHGGE